MVLISVAGDSSLKICSTLIFTLSLTKPESRNTTRNGFRLAYKKREMPKPKDLLKFGERWRPHATTAAWYLWRAADAARKK